MVLARPCCPVTARVTPAIGQAARAAGARNPALRPAGMHWQSRYSTGPPPESGQDRGEAHECYGNIGHEDRDAHAVEPEPPNRSQLPPSVRTAMAS